MTQREEELKPCPFCGGEKIRDGYIRDGRRIYCADCSASVTAFHPNASESATKLWNCRPKIPEWIEWSGGDFLPVPPEVSVSVLLRDGSTEGPAPAREFGGDESCWQHRGSAGDIVAYALVTTPKPEATAPIAYVCEADIRALADMPDGTDMSIAPRPFPEYGMRFPLYDHPPKPEATEGGAHEKGKTESMCADLAKALEEVCAVSKSGADTISFLTELHRVARVCDAALASYRKERPDAL